MYEQTDRLLAEFKKHGPWSQWGKENLYQDFLVEFTYHSNAIEGNTLTLEETKLAIEEGLTVSGKPIRDYQEVVGHERAIRFIMQLVHEKEPLSEWVIKELHEQVLLDRPEHRGNYRTTNVMVGSHIGTKPEWIGEQMEQLVEDYEKHKATRHPIQSAAQLHLGFEGNTPVH